MFMTRKSVKEQLDWVLRKASLGWKGLKISQRETYLREEIAAWRSDAHASYTTADKPVKIVTWEKELK